MASRTLKCSQRPQLLSSQISSLTFGPGTAKLLGAAYSLAGISSQHLRLFPAHPGISGGKEGGRHTLSPGPWEAPQTCSAACPGSRLPAQVCRASLTWVFAPGGVENANRAHLVQGSHLAARQDPPRADRESDTKEEQSPEICISKVPGRGSWLHLLVGGSSDPAHWREGVRGS